MKIKNWSEMDRKDHAEYFAEVGETWHLFLEEGENKSAKYYANLFANAEKMKYLLERLFSQFKDNREEILELLRELDETY